MNDLQTLFKVHSDIQNPIEYLKNYIFNKPTVIILKNGLRINARPYTFDRSSINEVFLAKNYNPPGFEIKENDVVVDIGAYIGVFSLYAAFHAPNGQIFCFEPTKETFNELEENIKRNHFENIKACNYAITNGKYPVIEFNLHEISALNSIYSKGNAKAMVEAHSLEWIFYNYSLNKIDFLKIDCEGAEYELLESLPVRYFSLIQKMAIEAHYLNEEYNPERLIKFLKEKGYAVMGHNIGKDMLLFARRL